MLSSCLLRIRAILFFCNRVFRKGLSHVNYCLQQTNLRTLHRSMKKWISQNEDDFLIKETKNVISFHAKNSQGPVKEQKKLEFLLPSALLQKKKNHSCHWIFRHLCWCLLCGIQSLLPSELGNPESPMQFTLLLFSQEDAGTRTAQVSRRTSALTSCSTTPPPLLYSCHGGPEQSSSRHSAGNSPFPHRTLGGLNPSAPDPGPSCTSLNNSRTPALPCMASFLGASCPQWSKEPEENRSQKRLT